MKGRWRAGWKWAARLLLSAAAVTAWIWVVDQVSPPELLRQLLAPGDVPRAPFGRVSGALLSLLLMGWLLAAGLAAVRWVLSRGGGPLPIAKLVVQEASRMRGSVIPIGLLLLIFATIPASLNPDSPLRYRIQSFLAYSHATLSLLLGAITVFLGCYTISSELQGGQAHTVFSKPVNRRDYLLGKLMGIALLDALMLCVGGAGIVFVTQVWLARLPALDAYDARAVREQVLTARETVAPACPYSLADAAEERLARLREENPSWIAERGGEAAVRRELLSQAAAEWMSIGPLKQQIYLFSGLERARAAGGTFQLRFSIERVPAPKDNQLSLGLVVNGRRLPLTATVGTAQVLPLSASLIDASGKVELVVVNLDPYDPESAPEASISFPGSGGLELLYRVGSFAPNLARGLGVVWVKLLFLAMVAVSAGAFLSFPVACILSLTIWVLAAGSAEILEALHLTPHEHGASEATPSLFYDKFVVPGMTLLASGFRKYGERDIAADIVDGRHLSWRGLGEYALWIGLIWTSLAGLGGWLIFRRREIARVQV